MLKRINLNLKQICPVLVISTMSSGKSTLINAIIDKELLPASNCACTVKATAILNNDTVQQFRLHTIDKEERYCFIEQATEREIANSCKSNDIDEILIECNISGIKNGQKTLLLIDTPGLDYYLDQSHEKITKTALNKYKKGIILYVINTEQMATYADRNALKLAIKKTRNNPNFKIIFVINKMDLLNVDRERPDELVENCRKYIQGQGINDPLLIPVSARSALIFKKVLAGETLTQMEKEDFDRNYKRFKRNGYSLTDYISIPGRRNNRELLTVNDEKFTYAEIYAALDHTGLPFLERIIHETLNDSVNRSVPVIKVSQPAQKQKKRLSEARKKTADGDKQPDSAEEKLKKHQAIRD